ncbi:DUF2919 family protein [Salmonella enterica]|uniref:DUF2919 family protein n=1 Tax=Salmonella enterica TaxID=28901 RepID=UPI00107845D4|nr:DUF2919 family protein [Salmonella enterica]EAA3133798.1 DUF2919 domain-containing protein [Salmonella enterica subsp. enterica serovar Chester]EGE9388783.1 DUF2919 domain-containing protein [Salmonella enterica subsp. enterica serovar Bredeney]EDH8246418.1 DUF2919 domain-containing protein [Salmonella enterica subsp. enterica serovar Chester]EGL8376475.1 DUF2919 domain-containing protein [Salmonella enterica]EIT1501235.1 DUF2919 family protein [Salmonella enterica]
MRAWRVEDFDNHGNLRVRKGMWWALFLLAHPWWLVTLEMSMENGEGRILPAIYPTAEMLYAGLACSASVFVFLFVCPFRHAAPRVMAVAYALVLMVCVLMMVRVCVQVYHTAGMHDELLWLSLFFLTLGCLVELWPDARNRETYYFFMPDNGCLTEGLYAGYKK